MKVIVYTVNLGGYDKLNPAPNHYAGFSNDFRFLYFTDGEAPEGWEKVPIEIEMGGRKESRFWKMNSHLLPEHDISIYVDAGCQWVRHPAKMVSYLADGDIGLCEHPKEKCIYQHAYNCMRLKLDNIIPIFKQIGKYADEGMPEGLGLTENCVILRANNKHVKKINELWWKEYKEGSQRDQLSLPYVLWKLKPKVTIMPFSSRENKWFSNNLIHLKSRNV
jgi:hypothetical protein